MEMLGLEPKITICKIAVLPVKLHPLPPYSFTTVCIQLLFIFLDFGLQKEKQYYTTRLYIINHTFVYYNLSYLLSTYVIKTLLSQRPYNAYNFE